MRIKRVFNNNTISAYRDNDEVVIFGRGVGFAKKHGDKVDSSKIEKIFVTSKKQNAYLESLFNEVPASYIDLTYRALKQAESDLASEFGSSTFIAVLDHINFALARAKKGQFISNPLLWEIRNTYGTEYRAALKTLDIIEEEVGVRLPPDEAGTIAIHYFNAQDPSRHLKSTYKAVELIRSIVDAIQTDFDVAFDEESIDFNRLMTHLRFFVLGLMSDEYRASDSHNSFLFDQVSQQYPKSHACALHVRDIVRDQASKDVGNEELLYLMIHIQRVTEKARQTDCEDNR